VTGVAEAYRSTASEEMLNGWQRLSSEHVSEIVEGSAVLAAALDVAAGYIVAQKAEAIGVLIGMAAAFVAPVVPARPGR
jgi:hypothetical protein